MGDVIKIGNNVLASGTATEAKQDIQITEAQTTNTKIDEVKVKQDTQITALNNLLIELQLKADLSETQPVSVASLPLPTGASTLLEQQTQSITLSNIYAGLGTVNASINTLLKPADTLAKVTAVDTITNPVSVTGTFYQATQPVSASSLPLPSGASTEATLALIKAKTDNIDVLLSTRTKPADIQLVSLSYVPTHAVTQSGTWTVTSNEPQQSTASISRVSVTNASTTLKTSNSSRITLIIFNEGNQPIYVKYGSTASVTDYTIIIPSGQGYTVANYTGIVTAITSASTSNVQVTEL